MDNNELLDNLKLIVGDTQVRTGEPMNIHTTFRIGGCADYYVQPSSIEELQSLIRFLNKSDICYSLHIAFLIIIFVFSIPQLL